MSYRVLSLRHKKHTRKRYALLPKAFCSASALRQVSIAHGNLHAQILPSHQLVHPAQTRQKLCVLLLILLRDNKNSNKVKLPCSIGPVGPTTHHHRVSNLGELVGCINVENKRPRVAFSIPQQQIRGGTGHERVLIGTVSNNGPSLSVIAPRQRECK
jgi:hypothetical protein